MECESVVRAIRDFFVAPTTSFQKGRCIPFSPVDPRVGSVICSRVRRQFGATQSHLLRCGKGADEYNLTSPLPRLRTLFMPESGSSGHVLQVLDRASLAPGASGASATGGCLPFDVDVSGVSGRTRAAVHGGNKNSWLTVTPHGQGRDPLVFIVSL